MSKHKKIDNEKHVDEPGSFRYGISTRQNPIEFYHSHLEFLKEKRKNRRNNKKSILKYFIKNRDKEE